MKKKIGYGLLGLCSIPIIASWVYMFLEMNWFMALGLLILFGFVALIGLGLYLIKDDL